MSKELFKAFVSKNPSLAAHVNNGSMTWQKFYEMFDLYGEDSSVWNKYLDTNNVSVGKINDLIKNVDMNSIKEHIDTAQKALDFVQELTGKQVGKTSSIIDTPRPLNKFFED